MSRNFDLLRTVQPRSDLRARYSPPVRLAPVPVPPSQRPSTPPPTNNYDWQWAFGVLRRRWLLSVAFLCVVVTATAVATFLTKPVYTPEARVEVDPPGSEAFTLQSGNADSNDIDRIMETQSQILNSDELAIKLIRQLRLDTKTDISGKFAAAARLQPPSGPANRDALTPAENAAFHYLQLHLKASTVKGSRVISVSFTCHQPALARDVVNTLVKLYLEKNYESRYTAVSQSSEWLSRQLDDIREKADASNRALAEYQKLHNITDINEQQNTFAVKVSDLTQQLTQAQADRIQLEAFNNSIQQGEGDSLPQVRDNPVIQTLTKNLADTQTELSQAQVIYGKNHPNVEKLENAQKELQAQLARQRQTIVDGVKTSYLAAKGREQMMSQQLQATTAGVNAMGEYSILKHDAQVNTDLYNTLYTRIKEAGIAAASKSSNIRVIEDARLLSDPSSPKPMQNLVVAFMFGLVGGILVAFVRDRFDAGIRRPEEVPQLASMPSVTFIPRIEEASKPLLGGRRTPLLRGQTDDSAARPEPFLIENPDCDGAEAVRTLVSSLLLGSTDSTAPRVLLMVSGFPQEGKTTLAVNLALALAELSPTCIVDADLRRPAVGPSFGLEPDLGIADVLSGRASIDSVLHSYPGAPNLKIAPAGTVMANAGTALMSASMGDLVARLRERFSYVIIDSPPILGYADARALAPLADGVVLVARYAQSTREGIGRTMDVLRQLHANVLAFVLNEVDADSGSSYKYPYTGNVAR